MYYTCVNEQINKNKYSNLESIYPKLFEELLYMPLNQYQLQEIERKGIFEMVHGVRILFFIITNMTVILF